MKTVETATGAPRDYAELYECYFGMMKSIVAKAGIAAHDVEDVAMEILTKFMERDGLSWYDPDLLHDVGRHPRLDGPRRRPARFQGLLRSFTSIYVRQHLDRQRTRAAREPHRLEEPSHDGEATWSETHGHLTTEHDVAEDSTTDIARASGLLRAEALRWHYESETTVSRSEALHATRRAAELIRAARALETAARLAENDERVTARAIAKINGCSSQAAGHALRTARAQLRAETG